MIEQIGPWIIETPLGRGGSASVYRCHHFENPDQKRAIKVIFQFTNEEARHRFEREAEVLFALHHPSVVKVYDVSSTGDMPYILMEYVEGENLATRLARGPLPFSEACSIFRQIADGLRHAHELGIRHRDIKPGNIMLCPDGSARILDFGIAMVEGRTGITGVGKAVGTVRYMPPEILGRTRPDGVRWDIYSLGVMLFEALTGEVGFREAPGEAPNRRWIKLLQSKQVHPPLDPGPAFPQTLRNLVRRATEANPDLRLNSVASFVTVLGWVERSTSADGHRSEYPTDGVELPRPPDSGTPSFPLSDSGAEEAPESDPAQQSDSSTNSMVLEPTTKDRFLRGIPSWRSSAAVGLGLVGFLGLATAVALWWVSR